MAADQPALITPRPSGVFAPSPTGLRVLALKGKLSVHYSGQEEQAVAQAWSVDWTKLAALRRKAAEATATSRNRQALRHTGEIITLLGQAARFQRKNSGSAGVV